MPEGDTIHRIALRIDAALVGRTLEWVEARGKHLLLHLSEERVLHSQLGINGRWFVRRPAPRGRGEEGRVTYWCEGCQL
jgi:endonuclease-8